MTTVCCYFQIHQPRRLRRYSSFEIDHHYFDDVTNERIVRKVAQKCYIPATRVILDLIRRHGGKFRVSFSITGCVVEQFEQACPEVLDLLRQAAATGCVEFLSETYYHSLAFLYSLPEFDDQVRMHAELMERVLGQRPEVFRNTELIYSNSLSAHLAAGGRFRGVLAEGADRLLGARSPNRIYRPPSGGANGMKLLLKNYRLSDDIAFRFSNSGWSGWPLTADKFARWTQSGDGAAQVCNLFMDFETFGEHQWAETGIFQFLDALPGQVLGMGGDFKTPSECLRAYPAQDEYDVPNMISWADTERDLSAWISNAMQSNALNELYRMESSIKASGDAAIVTDWRHLTASDHFYYMCTKYPPDGDVHKYFNPYESPYDAYLNFMNALDSLRDRVEAVRV
jgi:alpha-amylase